jgi:hypothetical protein
MERVNHKKLNEVEGRERCRVGMWNRFAALGDLDEYMDVKSTWETIRENIKVSVKDNVVYYESNKSKPRFDE